MSDDAATLIIANIQAALVPLREELIALAAQTKEAAFKIRALENALHAITRPEERSRFLYEGSWNMRIWHMLTDNPQGLSPTQVREKLLVSTSNKEAASIRTACYVLSKAGHIVKINGLYFSRESSP